MTIGPVDGVHTDTRSRTRNLFFVAAACVVALVICLGMFRSASAASGRTAKAATLGASSSTEAHSATQGVGYWLAASDGGIFSEGGAPFKGSTGGTTLNKPIVGLAATPDGNGYWLVASDGGIFNYGDAAFEGSAGSLNLNKPIVGMASTADGKGYWLVASDGGIFNYGDAAFEGSAGSLNLNKPIVGMASTADGKGYWLVASDGGIFSYGDAAFYGSTGALSLNKPIMGMASSPDGKGYWLVASDGGIFNYGDAAFYGSTGGISLNKPIVGMAASPDGKGYWLAASDGGIFNYGDAAFDGSTGGMHLNNPIVGMAMSGISGQASKLVFSIQPSGASGGTEFSTQPAVTVEDAAGNPVTTDHSSVTIGIAPGAPTNGGPGTLSTCTSTGESKGVFSFSGCTINTAGGGYKLLATDGQQMSATSAPFSVMAGPPTHILFSTEPSNAIGGSAFVNQPVITIQDAGNNTVTSDTQAIALTIESGPGALSGCSATTVAGVATFSGCSITTAGTYTLAALNAGDNLNATSSSFAVGTGVPSQLAFTTEPGSATGGTAFAAQPVVTVEDPGGNTVTTAASTVTLAIGSGPGSLSGCTATTTAGVAAFSGCSINTAGSHTLMASDGSLTAATSNPFNVTVGGANHLAVTTSPAGATGGTAFGTQPVVTVQDAGNNTVTANTSTVTLSITAATPATGGPGTLSCTPTAAINGVASFTGCSIDTAGTGYELHAVDGSLGLANSAAFNVTVGGANHLAVTTSPAGATGGTAFGTQPVVTVQDAGDNTVTTNTSTVTLSSRRPHRPPGDPARSPAPRRPPSMAWPASPAAPSTRPARVTSSLRQTIPHASRIAAFNVTVGGASQLVVTTQPSDAAAGSAIAPSPAVTVEDAGGNTVTADTSTVALAITAATPATGGPGTLTCAPAAVTNGVATFDGCSIDTVGTGYQLTATDDALTPADSTAFDIGAGSAAQLAVTTSPAGATGGTAFGTQPVVTVQDAEGNTVTTDNSTVALVITGDTPATGGPGTLTCTPTAAINGVASFTGCSIDTAGTGYQLTASDNTLTPADTAAFDVTVGGASQLVVTTQPSDAAAGSAIAPSPAVTVEDAGGNTVTADTSTVALAITAATPATGGPGTLTCAPAAVTNGVATFDGCSIDTVGTGYQLTATDDALTPADSTAFDIGAGSAAQLAVTTSPAGATGGTAFGTQPVVTVQDAEGNTVTTDNSTVALVITGDTPATGGPGTLTCTPTAAINGVASFTGCSIDTAGTGYQLTASDNTLTPADTAAFDVTVGGASQLVFTTQPGSATAGNAFGIQPVVTVEDAGGNTVTSDTDPIAMAIGSGEGTLSGCSETTTAGVGAFSGCSIDTGGPYTLSAGDGPFNTLSDSFIVVDSQ